MKCKIYDYLFNIADSRANAFWLFPQCGGGERRGSNLWVVGFSVVSEDQLANLHSVSLRYLVTFRVNVRRKKKRLEILHLLCVVRLKTALLAPVNPNRAWLITYMYHNVENA